MTEQKPRRRRGPRVELAKFRHPPPPAVRGGPATAGPGLHGPPAAVPRGPFFLSAAPETYYYARTRVEVRAPGRRSAVAPRPSLPATFCAENYYIAAAATVRFFFFADNRVNIYIYIYHIYNRSVFQ